MQRESKTKVAMSSYIQLIYLESNMNTAPKTFYVHTYLYLPVSNLIKTRQCAGDICDRENCLVLVCKPSAFLSQASTNRNYPEIITSNSVTLFLFLSAC